MSNNTRLNALINWLQAGAPGPESWSEVVAEVGRRMNAAELPVDQIAIYKTLINPELPAHLDYWNVQTGAKVKTYSPDIFAGGTEWYGAPAQICMTTGRALICTLGEAPQFDDREDIKSLKARGYTQLFYLPLHSRYTPSLNVVGFLTKRTGGFATADIDALNRLQAPIARVTEGFNLHESTIAILSTYVGRNAGAQVLSGNIRRGESETIPAVVLFVDIKNYTEVSNTLAPNRVVALLNRFFEVIDDAIRAHGGEILKLLGDGVLGIFPTPDDFAAKAAAAASALAAVEDARNALKKMEDDAPLNEFRAALHHGEVHYGNIGSTRRLDFTVIGPTVNLASRLLAEAANLEEDIVCSEEFTRLLEISPRSLGTRELKGFAGTIKIHAID